MKFWTTAVLVMVMALGGVALADPQVPLHQIEGSGGVVLTEMAYLVNPSETDSPFGLPSVSVGTLVASKKSLNTFTISETLFKKIELSYSLHRFFLGDFGTDTGLHVAEDNQYMHIFNARVLLIEEGACDQAWMPAVTAGFHYKRNISVRKLNSSLGGALKTLGLRDEDGEEYTITATKTIAGLLPKSLIVSATARSTDAAQLGYVGFTHDREIMLEGNVAYVLLDNLVIGAEYRQKPNHLTHMGNVVSKEHDWWSLAASYTVSENLNVTLAYANIGAVLNHREPASVWLQVKYDF